MEVCRALDYAHRRMKVVHRDITPRNVMIDEEGQVKLIDFGIAAPALVAGHEILGSPGHMAPEQIDGGELGPPTDIFAVAVLLMEAWSGVAPFRRATPEECSAAVREPHPKPSDVGPRLVPLDAAISRAMHVDARERQQEASDLARALRSFLQEVDTSDIARALGDRVRELREVLSATSPPSPTTAPRPSAASHGDLGTKTFAAREEALRWSRPPAEVLDDDDVMVPSTRKLAESPSAPRILDPMSRNDSASRPLARREDPSMGLPTPLMVDVDELERIHADIAAGKEAPPPPPVPVRQADIPTMRRAKLARPMEVVPAPPGDARDTTAAEPLETPVLRAERSRSGRFVPVVLALLIVAIGGAAVWRMRPKPAIGTSPTATPTAAVREPAPRPIPDAPKSALPAPPPPPASAAPKILPSTTSPAGKAAVTLIGDPGTRVSVDGVSRGACPVRLALDTGPHDVRFTFDPTGESRGERFIVKSGEQVTVRAEFTGATPTVKILR